MQIAYVLNGVVTSVLSGLDNQAIILSNTPGEVALPLEDTVQVAAGWTATPSPYNDGTYSFAAPTKLPVLTPMKLYLAFTTQERLAIKASKDPLVVEFWALYNLAAQLNSEIDPNLVSVQEALAYLAAPAVPGPGAGILASPARIPEILAGVAQ